MAGEKISQAIHISSIPLFRRAEKIPLIRGHNHWDISEVFQMKSAMTEILAEIPADDSVNIILFDKYNQLWKKESVRLDDDRRAEAVKVIFNILNLF